MDQYIDINLRRYKYSGAPQDIKGASIESVLVFPRSNGIIFDCQSAEY